MNKEQLLSDGFTLEEYPDGMFWVYRHHDECFLQLKEDFTNITLYDNGWVEDNLSEEEYHNTMRQFKEKGGVYDY